MSIKKKNVYNWARNCKRYSNYFSKIQYKPSPDLTNANDQKYLKVTFLFKLEDPPLATSVTKENKNNLTQNCKDAIVQNSIKLHPDLFKNLEKNTDNGHKNLKLNTFPKFEGSQVPTLFNDG